MTHLGLTKTDPSTLTLLLHMPLPSSPPWKAAHGCNGCTREGEEAEGKERKETRQAEHAGEEEMSAPMEHPPSHSCTYQPVEEVGHLHLGEVGGFDLWFLVRFGWQKGEESTYTVVRQLWQLLPLHCAL